MTLAAVCQLTSTACIPTNLSTCLSLITRSAASGAKVVFLPEASDFISSGLNQGPPGEEVARLTRSRENFDFVEGLKAGARREGVWISVGVHEDPQRPILLGDSPSPSLGKYKDPRTRSRIEELSKPVDDSRRCFNSHLIIDDAGHVACKYRKTHLFDVDIVGGLRIKESDTTIPGTSLESPVQTPLGRVGALTCYDLRFPEPSLSLRRQGTDVLLYPSAFTQRTGSAHWSPLLRARAIETQSYVIAAAQVGVHNPKPDGAGNRSSYGHAMIVDPWGSIVAQCPDVQPYRPTFALAEIDLSSLASLRKEMPLWEQRRDPSIYPTI